MTEAKRVTETVNYSEGCYYRVGNRIVLNGDFQPPAGFIIIPESKRVEPGAFRNLAGGRRKDGISYEVRGWSDENSIRIKCKG